VLAVSLGGSRATREHRPDSDWDFALYYRGHFDVADVRQLGWPGDVSAIGGWGGGVMNGGAWLRVDGRRVDLHYRDLDDVEHWWAEARRGRFREELLMFYLAGIPTYVVVGELAIHRLLVGDLPRPEYPEALRTAATARWLRDAELSLGYARAALDAGHTTVALGNAARAILEASHGRLAARGEWALNEKRLAERAGLATLADRLVTAGSAGRLANVLDDLGVAFDEAGRRP
jgi:predicted nucleotidyltransferase